MAVLSRPASLNSNFSNSGRFIKARPVAAMAGLSPRSGRIARSLDLDCGWPISYCPVQAVYQRPSRAIFKKSWQNERPLYQTGQPHSSFASCAAPYKASNVASYKAPHKASCTASKASYKASYEASSSSKASYKASFQASYKASSKASYKASSTASYKEP